ncbi:hypothetical protein I5M27_04285 [Adhaeribacter sp. BT258]|uniref:Sel1 repeat family protein n=1 Tax=Adhaeribacter terrigena TaxID=2793070 RepID=A0ABS1BYR5_9BACT|nr:hypothetical protein [Adhaeribacter terrigena]MBK0402188.1 hypothetical protein [Adhaeribacter terrigena]
MILFFTFWSFFHSVFAAQEINIPALRQLFYEARDSEKKADLLFEKIGNYGGKEGILIAYKAGAYALKAKYGANPLNKLKNVKKAQQYFSEAVQRDPQNLEIRFMRYAVEVQTPDFIGYSEHVNEDKNLLLNGLRKFPNSGFTLETATIARDFMRQYCECSEQEKQFVQQLRL